MANLHRGMCLDCDAYRADIRQALALITNLSAIARRAGATQEELLALLARAPEHRIDDFLERSIHERETQPDFSKTAHDTLPSPPPSPENEDEPSDGDVVVIGRSGTTISASVYPGEWP